MGGNGASLKRERWMANERTQAQHNRVVKELGSSKYPDFSTYNIATLSIDSYQDGYQVTFWNVGDNYSPQEYADKVNEFLKYVPDHVTNAGKYGTPEISFRIPNMRTALRLARKYNQISVWDWKNQEEIRARRFKSGLDGLAALLRLKGVRVKYLLEAAASTLH